MSINKENAGLKSPSPYCMDKHIYFIFCAHRWSGMFDEIVLLWSWSLEVRYEIINQLFRMDLGDGGCSSIPIPMMNVWSTEESKFWHIVDFRDCFCQSISCQPVPQDCTNISSKKLALFSWLNGMMGKCLKRRKQ